MEVDLIIRVFQLFPREFTRPRDQEGTGGPEDWKYSPLEEAHGLHRGDYSVHPGGVTAGLPDCPAALGRRVSQRPFEVSLDGSAPTGFVFELGNPGAGLPELPLDLGVGHPPETP